MPRYLSKSRFKIAVDCPAKLNYSGKPDYVDNKQNNDFLKALAEGGFQVGELAKLLFPGGVEVIDPDQEAQIHETAELLKRDNVVIFEGTVQYGDWVARIDVINKLGSSIELIEVKSKSFDSRDGNPEQTWRNSRPAPGQRSGYKPIGSSMLPYLQDVAFQTLILRRAHPTYSVTPFLMMPDKAEVATVDGLNQKFKIHIEEINGRRNTCATAVQGTTRESIGNPLLKTVDVSTFVDQIFSEPLKYPGDEGLFEQLSMQWARDYASSMHITPVIGAHCRDCEFHTDMPDTEHKSGFHECWRQTLDATPADIANKRPVTSLYWPARGQLKNLMAKQRYWLSDLEDDDLNNKVDDEGLTRDDRRRLQVWGEWNDNHPFYFDRTRWRAAMQSFRYPLHFIDFEGSRPALPFTRGKRPFDQVAFQFSHHTIDHNGTVRHASEFIDLEPGKDPSIPFLRALYKALTAPGSEHGTVFMWSHYENTMLNDLREGLLEMTLDESALDDANELITFIDTLTVRKQGKKVIHQGDRAIVDLCKFADKLFFHPDTEGRSSIKVVLPAVLKSSMWLRDCYSQSIYGALDGIESKNFPLPGQSGMTWWQASADGVKNPYELLPPIFSDFLQEELDAFEMNDKEELREGGAATAAYARLQFSDVPENIRNATKKALLRYCELDTLAMVMVFEAWREWAND